MRRAGGAEAGADFERTEPNLRSSRVGDYDIVELIGRGGMAAVYLARQRKLNRLVALKELAAAHAADPQFAKRFLRESQMASSIAHSNVVTVYGYFEHGGIPYIAMEYLPAGSLRPLIGSLSNAQIVGTLEGILAGLAAAARRGIVHRDLKPENILISGDGQVKIADFGIAKAMDAIQSDGFETQPGAAVGTPAYMAPEQAEGLPVDPRTDLYSLGVIAYELLAGELPISRDGGALAVLRRQVDQVPVPLAQRGAGVDPRLGRWVDRLLAKRPEERPPGPAEAREELEEVALTVLGPRWRRDSALLAPATPAHARELEPEPAPLRQRRARVFTLAAAVVAAIGAGTAAAISGLGEDAGPTAPPRTEAARVLQPVVDANRRLTLELQELRRRRSAADALSALRPFRRAAADAHGRLRALPADARRAVPVARALAAAREWATEVEHALARGSDRMRRLEAAASAYAEGLRAAGEPAPDAVTATATLARWAVRHWRVRLRLPATVRATSAGAPVRISYSTRATRGGRRITTRCRPASGSAFPVGMTTVRCAAGGSRGSFRVVVTARQAEVPESSGASPSAPPQQDPAPLAGAETS